jgi:hypothetical protein
MSDNLVLGIVAGLAFAAIALLAMFITVAKVSTVKPPAPVYLPRPSRLQRFWTLVLKLGKFVSRKANIWLPVFAHLAKNISASLISTVREHARRRRVAETIHPPFPAERTWRIATRHRPLHAAGHLVIVSDYPDHKSRAVLRPRSRLSQRIVLGELETSSASDLEYLRLAKAHRVS